MTGEYAVFIDQYHCFHSDYIYEVVPFPATPKKYFPTIQSGLKKISEIFNVGIRIAAHPRSSYQQGDNRYFPGYPIEYGKTGGIIKDCKMIVCHDSTSIQFAVLFGKPAIFVTTDEFNSAYEGKSIAKIASELGKSAINLDRDLQDVDWQKELYVDTKKYAEYINNYIKTNGSPDMPFWDIVMNYIENKLNQTLANLSELDVATNKILERL